MSLSARPPAPSIPLLKRPDERHVTMRATTTRSSSKTWSATSPLRLRGDARIAGFTVRGGQRREHPQPRRLRPDSVRPPLENVLSA